MNRQRNRRGRGFKCDEMDIKPPVDNQLPEVNSRQLPGSFGGPLPPDLDQQPSMLSGGSAPHVAGAGQQQTAHMVGARGGQQQAPYMADAGQQQAAHMMGAGGGQQQAPHMVGAGAYQQTQKGSAMLVESPFIHQHSQIFVFSTDLANKAAGAVYHGLCKSIVDFHVQQPGMRELLLKQTMMTQNRPPWPSGMVPGEDRSVTEGPMSSVEQWVQQQNNHLQQGNYQQMGANNVSLSHPYQQSGGQSWPSAESRSPHCVTDDFQGGLPLAVGRNGHHLTEGFGPGGPLQHAMGGGPHVNLQQSKVPNEILTPEQLQHREDRLANIRKLQMMLLPDQQPPLSRGTVADLVGPGGPMMSAQFGPPSMIGPPVDMMHASSPMAMMADPNMPPFNGGGGGNRALPNWDNMSMEQREWYKMQQEYYADKVRKQQAESMFYGQMQSVAMTPQRHPSPFYPSMQSPHGIMSPQSPSHNGRMPHPGLDPRISPISREHLMRSGMMPHGMQSGHVNNFEPASTQSFRFDPTLEPSISDFMCPQEDMKVGGPGGQLVCNLTPVMRVNNEQQFHSELMDPGGMGASGSKALPVLGNKRKSATNDMDELHKRLQPAPSPQHFSYVNQFDGQELTITRQANVTYHDTRQSNIASPLVPQAQPRTPVEQQQVAQSPASHNDVSGVNRSLSTGATASPPTMPSSIRPSSVYVTSASSLPTASLSSSSVVDSSSLQRTSVGMSGNGDHSNRSLTVNITSSSLEKLAKGVEQLSQSLTQVGSYHPSSGSDMPVSQSPTFVNGQQGHAAERQSPRVITGHNYMPHNGFNPMARFAPTMSDQPMPYNNDGGPIPPMNGAYNTSSPSDLLSVSYQRPISGTTMGNANVQIQSKAPNTIQYMPVANNTSLLPEIQQQPMRQFDMILPPPRRSSSPPVMKRSSYSPRPPDVDFRMPKQGQAMQGGGMLYGSSGPVAGFIQGRPPRPIYAMNCPPDMYPMQQHMSMPGVMMGSGGPSRSVMGAVMAEPSGVNGGPHPGHSYQSQQFQQQLNNRPRSYGPDMGGMMGGGPMSRPDVMESDMMSLAGGHVVGPGGPMSGMVGRGMNMLPSLP